MEGFICFVFSTIKSVTTAAASKIIAAEIPIFQKVNNPITRRIPLRKILPNFGPPARLQVKAEITISPAIIIPNVNSIQTTG